VKLDPLPDYRQSLLVAMGTCPRRTLHSLTLGGDWATGGIGTAGLLGTAFHAVAAEMLRTLWRTGEQRMNAEDALVLMRDVVARERYVLPFKDQRDLKYLTIGFSHYTWASHRILSGGLEQRLYADVQCPDGVTRRISGQPDLLMSDPPDGILCLDWKSGRGVPPAPRGAADKTYAMGRQYLSPNGTAQLSIYAYLIMANYPSVNRVVLRELHLRTGTTREADMARDEMEDVAHELGDIVMKLDLAIREGSDSDRWYPLPGTHCTRQCPVAKSCPIPVEQRGAGAIEDDDQADSAAAAYVVAKAQYEQLRDALKAHYEGTGYTPTVGHKELRWGEDDKGKRSWALHDPAPVVAASS
jgi:hypothetical protein